MSETKNEMTRRDFVKTGSTAIAAMTALGVAPSIGVAGANEKIRVGVIGTGSIANHHVKMLGAIKDKENCTIVSCFDVFGQRAEDYSKHVSEVFGSAAKIHKSVEEVANDKDVDTIIIASPEHQHFDNAMACLDAGKKHIYLEKPMCKSVAQTAALVKRAEKDGAIIQIGVHTTTNDVYLAARDYIQSGKLGTILQAQIQYCRHYYARGPWRSEHKTGDPKPESLDWNGWLGSAPKVDWDARRYYNWRCYWDYSGGIATDLFVHPYTSLVKMLGVKEPEYGTGYGDIFLWDDGRDIPDNYQMALKYPDGPMVYVLGTMSNKFGLQECIRGDKGTLVFESPGFKVYSEANETEGKEGYRDVIHTYEQKVAGNDDAYYQGNHSNFFAAVRAGDAKLLNSPPELGHYAVAAVNMANEGYKQKKLMKWDAAKGDIVPS